ncbi:MAG: DUF1345 domain-containing protein [Myxococcales bacterium]
MRLHHALPRAGIAAAGAAALAGALLGAGVPWRIAALAGWDAGAAVLLAFFWWAIAAFDPRSTRERAAADDPGRFTVDVLVLLTSGSSLLSTIVLVHRADSVLVALAVANVVLSWTLTHTAFALRYAHLYYREDDEGIGGVDFPGDRAPAYLDFAYVAFTVGMCFQVSDTQVTSTQIRRAVLLHAALSFLYNVAILAFVVNVLGGLAK